MRHRDQSFGSCSCPIARHRYLYIPTSAMFYQIEWENKTCSSSCHFNHYLWLLSLTCILNLRGQNGLPAEWFACVLLYPGPVRPSSVHPPAGSRYLLCEPMPSVLACYFCLVSPETPSFITKWIHLAKLACSPAEYFFLLKVHLSQFTAVVRCIRSGHSKRFGTVAYFFFYCVIWLIWKWSICHLKCFKTISQNELS